MPQHNGGTPVGLFSIGLETYWDQFPGLRDRLVGYHGRVLEGLCARGARVTDAGLKELAGFKPSACVATALQRVRAL